MGTYNGSKGCLLMKSNGCVYICKFGREKWKQVVVQITIVCSAVLP